VGSLLACGRTIKFHFCRANVFELAIKQRFSPPSQRTTRPRRGVGSFSFFVYSPTNWFCGIHRPFSSSSSSSSSTVLSRRLREAQSYFGVRKYTQCVCKGCQRAPAADSMCTIVDESQRGQQNSGFIFTLCCLVTKMYIVILEIKL